MQELRSSSVVVSAGDPSNLAFRTFGARGSVFESPFHQDHCPGEIPLPLRLRWSGGNKSIRLCLGILPSGANQWIVRPKGISGREAYDYFSGGTS